METKLNSLVAGTSIPLRYVTLKSVFKNGEVPVRVCENLPVKEVDMLLGNGFAGSMVVSELEITDIPYYRRTVKLSRYLEESKESKSEEEVSIQSVPRAVALRGE